MGRFKETISKGLVDIASIIVAIGLLLIMAGLIQVLSLGMDWVFNNNVTTEFIETVKLTGFFVGLYTLAGELKKMIRY